MKIPVLVEPVAGNGYVARLGPPFNWSAEGDTATKAVENLQQETDRRLTGGTQLAFITVPDGEHPILKWAGTLPDDEVTAAWRKHVEEYRDAVDRDTDRP